MHDVLYSGTDELQHLGECIKKIEQIPSYP